MNIDLLQRPDRIFSAPLRSPVHQFSQGQLNEDDSKNENEYGDKSQVPLNISTCCQVSLYSTGNEPVCDVSNKQGRQQTEAKNIQTEINEALQKIFRDPTKQKRFITEETFEQVLGVIVCLHESHHENELEKIFLCGKNFAIAVVGRKGASISFSDESVTLDVPPRALDRSQVIHLYRPISIRRQPTDNSTFLACSSIISCGPDGTKFKRPVTLKFPHFVRMREPSDSHRLSVFLKDEAKPDWHCEEQVELDVQDTKASVQMNHFTDVVLGESSEVSFHSVCSPGDANITGIICRNVLLSPNIYLRTSAISQEDFKPIVDAFESWSRILHQNKLSKEISDKSCISGKNFAVAIVGPEGASMSFSDHSTSLEIPPRALDQNQVIHIRSSTSRLENEADESTPLAFSKMISCGPDGTKFKQPVTLKFPHFAGIRESTDADGLSVFLKDEAKPDWHREDEVECKLLHDTVSVRMSHFTDVVLGASPELALTFNLSAYCGVVYQDNENPNKVALIFVITGSSDEERCRTIIRDWMVSNDDTRVQIENHIAHRGWILAGISSDPLHFEANAGEDMRVIAEPRRYHAIDDDTKNIKGEDINGFDVFKQFLMELSEQQATADHGLIAIVDIEQKKMNVVTAGNTSHDWKNLGCLSVDFPGQAQHSTNATGGFLR